MPTSSTDGMAKNNQGFRVQGGRAPAPKPSRAYTPQELDTLSRLVDSPDNTRTVVLCNVCGEPIAGSEKSKMGSRRMSDLGISPMEELRIGCHFICYERDPRARRVSARRDAQVPIWDREDLSEEERAKAFNDGEIIDPNNPVGRYQPYIPKPGELGFDKVKEAGGLDALERKRQQEEAERRSEELIRRNQEALDAERAAMIEAGLISETTEE